MAGEAYRPRPTEEWQLIDHSLRVAMALLAANTIAKTRDGVHVL